MRRWLFRGEKRQISKKNKKSGANRETTAQGGTKSRKNGAAAILRVGQAPDAGSWNVLGRTELVR